MARLGFGNIQCRLMVLIQQFLHNIRNIWVRTNDGTARIQIGYPLELRTSYVRLFRGLKVPLQASATATKLVPLNLPQATQRCSLVSSGRSKTRDTLVVFRNICGLSALPQLLRLPALCCCSINYCTTMTRLWFSWWREKWPIEHSTSMREG